MVDAEAARRLFGAVLICGIKDALSDVPRTSEGAGGWQVQKDASTNWITRNSKDFQEVCELAGLDPEFIRDAFMSGKITKKSFEKRRMHWAERPDLKKRKAQGKMEQERVKV